MAASLLICMVNLIVQCKLLFLAKAGFISRTLQLCCKVRLSYCYDMLSVCRLSVMQVHCAKITEASIMRFSKKVAKCLNLRVKFDGEIRRWSPSLGKTRVGWCSISLEALYLGNGARKSLTGNLVWTCAELDHLERT